MLNLLDNETLQALEQAVTDATMPATGRHRNIPQQRIAEAIANPAVNTGNSKEFYALLDARWEVDAGHTDAADRIRLAIEAPLFLTHRPRDVVSALEDLSVYSWADGIAAALLEDRWQDTGDAPYRYLFRAARGILWNQMRVEDKKVSPAYARRALQEKHLLVIRSTRRMEMVCDMEKQLGPLRKRNPDLYRLLKAFAAAADDKHAKVDRGTLARRLHTPETRLNGVLRTMEQKHGDALDALWQQLGGHIFTRKVEHDPHGKPHFSPGRKRLF